MTPQLIATLPPNPEDEETTLRRIHVLAIGAPDLFPVGFALPSRHFSLFLAMDANSVADELIARIAARALQSGAVLIHAFGADSSRVRDAFVSEIVARLDETEETLIKTVASGDWALSEALWHFLHTFTPSRAYRETCTSWLAVSIGRPDWAAEMSKWLAHPAALDEQVLGADDEEGEE